MPVTQTEAFGSSSGEPPSSDAKLAIKRRLTRPTAPAPLRLAVLAWLLLALPVLLGTMLDWPFFATYAAMLPGAFLSAHFERRTALERGIISRHQEPPGRRFLIVCSIGVMVLLAISLAPERYVLLALVVATIPVEALDRALWREHASQVVAHGDAGAWQHDVPFT